MEMPLGNPGAVTTQQVVVPKPEFLKSTQPVVVERAQSHVSVLEGKVDILFGLVVGLVLGACAVKVLLP